MTTPIGPDADNAFNWGAGAEGTNSGVFIAAKGATAPTDLTAWPTGWTNLGWLSDSGITEGHSMDTSATNAWQGGVLIRTIKSNETRTFQFQCLEENAAVMGLLRPGSTPTTVVGPPELTTTEVKSGTGSDIRAFGYDFIVGATQKRIICPTAEVTTFGDVVYSSTALTVYEFTVSVYPDENGVYYTEISNAPGVAVS